MPKLTDAEFNAFITAFRGLMAQHRQDPTVLEVVQVGADRVKATLPLNDGSRYAIYGEHLDSSDGTPEELARTVYDVYREDTRQ